MSLRATPLRLSTQDEGFEARFKARLHWAADTDAAIEQRVADILADVQQRGDAALLEYTARFDGLHAASVDELALTPFRRRNARHCRRRPSAYAPTTRPRSKPAARAGATAMPKGVYWGKK